MREKCKLTQREVAEQLGKSHQLIWQWENGRCAPNEEDQVQLLQLYKVGPLPTITLTMKQFIRSAHAYITEIMRSDTSDARLKESANHAAEALGVLLDLIPEPTFEKEILPAVNDESKSE